LKERGVALDRNIKNDYRELTRRKVTNSERSVDGQGVSFRKTIEMGIRPKAEKV